jgi:hypothetical protein
MTTPSVSLPKGLELKKSPVEGWGIFATQDFPKNFPIGEFIGNYMKHADFKKQYGNNIQYCYFKRRTWEYRVAKEQRNFITYINDGKHGFSEPKVNCYLKKWYAYTSRPIKAGEELFLDYGRYYKW